MLRVSSIGWVMAVVAFAVTGAAAQEAASDVVITLERTGCYGLCPAYKISVSGDGTVSYEGSSFVRIQGHRVTRIDPSAVKALVQEFQKIHYFELQDKYETIKNPDGTETSITDIPTVFTSLSLNGKTKKVKAYFGEPEELDKLAVRIDEVTGSKRWVTIDAEQVRDEIGKGWDVRSPEAAALLVDAAQGGDATTVKAFIDAGANVNANNELEMPIQVAGSAEVVRLLVAAGANVNGQTAGQNTDPALHYAARWGEGATVRELLKDGAHIDAKAWDGGTALMRAAERGDPEIVALLLDAGASVRGVNESGSDVLMCLRNGLISGTNYVYGKKREEIEARFQKARDLLIKAGATDSSDQAPLVLPVQ